MKNFFLRKINSLFFNLCKRKIGEEKKIKRFFSSFVFFKKEQLLTYAQKSFARQNNNKRF